jgi:hypothetical protein
MAKDRFSKFKRNNYGKDSISFTKLNYYKIPNRERLNDTQREFLVQKVKECNSDSGKKFLRSILVEGKIPTEKQKIVIKSILRKI